MNSCKPRGCHSSDLGDRENCNTGHATLKQESSPLTSRERGKYPVGVEVVDGPWQAGRDVEPKAADRGEVLGGNCFQVVAISVRDVETALEELDNNLELPGRACGPRCECLVLGGLEGERGVCAGRQASFI